jgi:UDP-N-acetylglucosamine--N-acetylmuramyl-(pentapeptide) pyrophosphoryl-undecaprenol N-acetylglucosamine transferase
VISSTLFLIAAGSGGHMLPAYTLAQQWKQTQQQSSVVFFTGTSPLERKLSANQPAVDHTYHVTLSKMSWWMLPVVAAQAAYLCMKSFFYIFKYRPAKIITTGGMHGLPICLAAWICRVPIELYELNVIPGKAVSALLPLATTVHHVFKATKQYCRWGWWSFASKCVLSDYPLRFTATDRIDNKGELIAVVNNQLRHHHDEPRFEQQRKTILIVGGSQGSTLLNRLMRSFVKKHAASIQNTIQIIHQTGALEENIWQSFYEQHHIPALTFGYDKRIHYYYQLADIVVCRAGAGTLFELAFFNRPSIVIPLIAHTTDHQVLNAQTMADEHPGIFTIIKQQIVAQDASVFFKILAEKIA